MPVDRSAALAALRAHVEQWPLASPLDGGTAIHLGNAVDDVLRAGVPDALVLPRWDPVTGPDTWHRIGRPDPEGKRPGVDLRFLPCDDECETWLRRSREEPECLGITDPAALHHAGLTACAVATAARIRRERT